MVRPFAKITQSIGDLTDGYDTDYLQVYTYEETGLISDAFNKMLGRLKSLDESRQEFVSNVSHELKTPLTSMKVLSDSILMQKDAPVKLYQENVIIPIIRVSLSSPYKIVTGMSQDSMSVFLPFCYSNDRTDEGGYLGWLFWKFHV